MEKKSREDQIIAVLVGVISESDLRSSADLFEDGLIDSIGLLTIVEELSSRFRIIIRDEELVPDNFSSLEKIDEFIVKKTIAA